MDTVKTALVTGASSGIGRAVAEALLADGFTVYGIGRTFPEDTDARLHKLEYDLTKTAGLPDYLKTNVPQPLSLLVNCAGCAYYGPHETLSPAAVHEMVAVNVEVPLLLTNRFLRDLQKTQGAVVNISSVTAKQSSNTYGCAYGATKAALSHFSEALFEETRKSGVRIITIHPDLTDTNLYRNADFRPAEEPTCVLTAQEVAEAVLFAVHARDGLVVSDITLRPQKNRIVRNKTE
ncbi:MAG: SDR family NAD(P)-dependent oxidoreductase [Lachnospiraceae bacterium]|nr:SDR family NAD(P)-dependent oxidoreductase [Lachnospiraceae bacterium]